VLLAAIAGTALLTGCGAGQQAQTASKEPSVPGVNANLGTVLLRNVQIGYPDRESRSYPRGATAPLEVRIFNSGTDPDALVGVRSDAADQVLLLGSDSETSNICPQASVSVPAAQPTGQSPLTAPTSPTRASGTAEATPGEPGDTAVPTPLRPKGDAEFSVELAPGGCALLLPGKPYRLELSGLREELAPGGTASVTFRFREAGEVTLQVPFGLPTDGPEHTPLDIHPSEPPVVGGHDTGESHG
jgi:copper(I)-binding protein